MTDAKAVFVDTNVLLSATAPKRRLHEEAKVVLNDWPNQGIVLATSAQVLREYLVVATRPVEANGLGLSAADALANVAAFRVRMRLLAEDEAVWRRLLSLISTHCCLGKQIHDANLVATAISAGVEKLVTANVADLARFAPAIEVIDLASVAPQ